VVAIHSHCGVLIKYAHSSRLRRHFHGKSFEIRCVSSNPIIIPWPSNFRQLVLDTVGGYSSAAVNSVRLDRIISGTRGKYFRNGSVPAPVHCECALIQHFTNPKVPWAERTPPPMDYLGVSKLSCNACTRFIAASNEHNDRKFYTRGNRDKWCFPWALPPPVNQEVSSAFLESMGGYIAHTIADSNFPWDLGFESDTDYVYPCSERRGSTR